MIENGLKYYDSSTSTEVEFTDDLLRLPIPKMGFVP